MKYDLIDLDDKPLNRFGEDELASAGRLRATSNLSEVLFDTMGISTAKFHKFRDPVQGGSSQRALVGAEAILYNFRSPRIASPVDSVYKPTYSVRYTEYMRGKA